MTVTQGDESSSDMNPGDRIVARLDAERTRSLPLWTAVTTVTCGMVVPAAAVNSF